MYVVRTLTNKVLGMKSHTDIFCDSELESHKFRGTSPFQNFLAGILLADRLGQCAIGDSPLRDGRHFRHSPYFASTGTVHVVTMPAIAGTGFEPVASRL